MKLSKIAKQLRREALANPKKAGFLGLLAVVAIYFWAPLVMKWSGGQDTKFGTTASAASSTPNSTAMPSAASPSTSAAEKPKDPAHRRVKWNEVVQWMDQDPRTRPAGPLLLKCDPFQAVKAVPVAAVKHEAPKVVGREITPQSLGMVLSGTILGAGRSVARISGRNYEQGRPVEVVAKDGKSFAFVLTQVEAKRVVLERAGGQYELKIQPSKSSGRIELLGRLP